VRGPKAARVIHRVKAKQAQKAGLWGANTSPPEETSASQRGIDLEAAPCTFAGVPVQQFSDDICCLLKEQTMIQRWSKALKMRSRL
jgi:hypothetical protein